MKKLNNNIEYCPHCGSNLQGEPIPEKKQHHYGGATHFLRKIGISSIELDWVIEWKCPDCKGKWERK